MMPPDIARPWSRRRALLVGAAALGLGACAMPAAHRLAEPTHDSPMAPPGTLLEVGEGVYQLQSAMGEVEVGNRGRIGNAGFIVGPDGVVVIDAGTSARHGQEILHHVQRITSQPVRLLLITQAHQEFLFGAAAFRAAGIPVWMHREASGLMQSRCERCLKTLREVLGPDEMRGTEMFRPDHVFDANLELDMIGRPVQVLYMGRSAGPGDVAVFDTRARVLFAGGLLDHQRVPDIQDADLAGWHAALRSLRAVPALRVVPGHGPSTAAVAPLIDTVDDYLARLQVRVAQLLADGLPLSEVADAAALPEFAHWDQYDIIHRRNASVLYVRLERDLLLRRAGTSAS